MNMEEILKPFGSVEKPHTRWADVFGGSQQGFYRGGGATGNDDFCGNLSICFIICPQLSGIISILLIKLLSISSS